jgi:hypothetical protein
MRSAAMDVRFGPEADTCSTANDVPTGYRPMMHKYSIGQLGYFEGPFQYSAARGQYKIVGLE